MKMSLRNLKIHNGMSEETTCFETNIEVDGIVVGAVKNTGRGGSNHTHWFNRPMGEAIEAWAKATPLHAVGSDGKTYEVTYEKFDHVVNELMIDMDFYNSCKRKCKKETVFTLKGDPKNSFRSLKKIPYSAEMKAKLVAKYGDTLSKIFNEELEIPFVEV